MAKTLAPTKGNLMMAKNTLRLSKQGYEMLDKKRNILIREMMLLIEEAKEVEAKIEETFAAAYKALESANVIMGVSKVQNLAHSAVLENSVKVDLRSVMGVEIPVVTADKPDGRPVYGFNGTSSALDEASVKFNEVKVMTVKLTEIENAVYRLAMNIKKTQKRANALENITIPLYDKLSKDIQNALEEKEREEFTRLKVIKRKEVAQKIKEAREQGDLSENAEYDAAKDEQRDIEARIEDIEKILKNAEVVVEEEVELDKISIGCKVKILDVEENEELEYKIVGSTEANSLKGKISNESPVGKALLGAKIGDVVKVETHVGELEYKVLEIQRSN